MDGIPVRINYGIQEMSFIVNKLPFKILDKKRTPTLVYLIKRLRIAAKEISELLREEFFDFAVVVNSSKV